MNNNLKEPQLLELDDTERIVVWHVREDGDVDYTIYTSMDEGILEISDETKEHIEKILKELSKG